MLNSINGYQSFQNNRNIAFGSKIVRSDMLKECVRYAEDTDRRGELMHMLKDLYNDGKQNKIDFKYIQSNNGRDKYLEVTENGQSSGVIMDDFGDDGDNAFWALKEYWFLTEKERCHPNSNCQTPIEKANEKFNKLKLELIA